MKLSSDTEMQKLTFEANEFYQNVLYDDEPSFVSDEANVWDISLSSENELLERIAKHYGMSVSRDDLKQPFWKLLRQITKSARRYMHEEIQSLLNQLDSATSDATALTTGLSEAEANTRLSPASWSITQCLDHLALTNKLYLEPMQKAAVTAQKEGKLRRRPAHPGFFGRYFIGKIEPPAKPGFRMNTIPKLRPEATSSLASAFATFKSSQQTIERFIHDFADLDLASIRYTNPIVRGLNFSLATGLNILLAHERRHLWQAWNIRSAIRSAAT